MNNNYFKDIEEIQDIEKGILKEFIRICDKHSLKYFLLDGSLLGAIRHQGMIPWDDDIDVGMFRSDFEEFLKIASREIRQPYIISNFKFTNGYKDYITQICNSVKYVETSYRKSGDIVNVWIDVFVIDGMPQEPVRHFFHKYNLLFHKMFLMWSDLDHYLVTGRENRPWYEKFAIKLCQIFHFEKLINSISALEGMDKCMKSVNPMKTYKTINFMSEYKWKTEFPIDYYGNGRMCLFDTIKVRIPDKSEEMLKAIYGNYMQLAPEDKRYKHSLRLLK